MLQELAHRIATLVQIDAPADWPDDVPTAFRTTFLPQVLNHLPPDASLVLLFDEFDVLDDPGEGRAGAAFFPYLRDLLTVSPRLQFAFVIGRRPEDLSSGTLSLFKGVRSERISLLDEEETERLVRLSQANGSLNWSDGAVARIRELTGGHPFLTQNLCQEIWESVYDEELKTPPTVEAERVDDTVPAALNRAINALEWLWNGLGPAERIVASALAESGPGVITQEELERQLQESGIRILVGELRNAPQVLQEWDLIEPANGGYCFRVELLRRWIAVRRPLSRVQEELDYIEPVAESLHQAAYLLFQRGQFDKALPLLRQVIATNPNHQRGPQVLAEILIARGELTEARQLLESLYRIAPAAARPTLVQVLLLQVNKTQIGKDRLDLHQQILSLDPNQSTSKAFVLDGYTSQILRFEKDEDFDAALAKANELVKRFPNVLEGKKLLASVTRHIERFRQFSHLVIEHIQPTTYRTSWYKSNQVIMPTESVKTARRFSMERWHNNTEDTGKTAFSSYLPDRAQKFVQTQRTWAIQLSTDWTDIPWELLHDGQDFLCLSRPMGRLPKMLKQPKDQSERPEGPLSALVIGNPTGDLAGSEAEARSVAKSLQNAKVEVDLLVGPEQATADEFSIRLVTQWYDLIHFAGHGYFDAAEPHLSGLLFTDGPVYAEELERGIKGSPFIFLSTCEATQTIAEENTMGFRGRFIEGLAISAMVGGAMGCLGPMWPIEDNVGMEFAVVFYNHVLRGIPFGEAVRQARLALRNRSLDFWASWILYGDPLAKLQL